MELNMTIDITAQDGYGERTEDCKQAEQEYKERIKNVLASECKYYTLPDIMKMLEREKQDVERKYEVIIIRNIKKHRISGCQCFC